ncbi:antitoxin Xre/MbcA/ParS toxin-binding domain-containing protein [Larkinella sp. VNQ87]|uniref:antitoxin Xre/MbcA/ParS toxin-binding domain-containing protein n=1 Tax=Larkinella sp. VNQ87 TaxID=3400921 RepID=UPI003C0E2705
MNSLEKSVSLEEVYAKGIEFFEDKVIFEEWLTKTRPALNDQKPLDLLNTVKGRKQVLTVLNALLYCIYL